MKRWITNLEMLGIVLEHADGRDDKHDAKHRSEKDHGDQPHQQSSEARHGVKMSFALAVALRPAGDHALPRVPRSSGSVAGSALLKASCVRRPVRDLDQLINGMVLAACL